MRVVSYADEHFLTSDGVAESVLAYSMALAQSGGSDVVRIPVLIETGPTWAEIIIGPASQIATLEVDDTGTELDDAATIEDLRRRREALEHPAARVGPDPDAASPDQLSALGPE